MSNVLIEENDIQAIADSIREKNGKTDTYKVADMPQAILDIEGGGVSRLPIEYQEVEYIESTGEQYINTGINGQNTLRVYTELSITKFGDNVFFGSRTSEGIQPFLILQFPTSPYDFRTDYITEITNITRNVELNERFSIDKNKNKTYINDELKATAPDSQFNNGVPITIFARNNGWGINAKASMKLYRFMMYNSDILKRDYVPCYRKSDKVIGLYDLVTNEFYTNAGTGTFLKGKDINIGNVILDVTNNDNISIEDSTLVIAKDNFNIDNISYSASGGGASHLIVGNSIRIIANNNTDNNINIRFKVMDLSNYAGEKFKISAIAKPNSVNNSFFYAIQSNSNYTSARTNQVLSNVGEVGEKTKLYIDFNVPSTITDDNRFLYITFYCARDKVVTANSYTDYYDIKIEEV